MANKNSAATIPQSSLFEGPGLAWSNTKH